MTTLAIDCSGKILNTALAADGRYWELTAEAGFRHGETLMSSVDALCSLAGIGPKEIELVAVTGGPGSFTGLRIGMATAKGLARGCGCPMKSVPTLDILAAGRNHWDGIVMPVMDARKGRVYAAAFQNGRRIVEDSDMDLDAFLAALPAGEKILATGPDAQVAAGRPGVTVDALHSAGRGRFIMETAWAALEKDGPDPHDQGPVYIRLSEAEEALVKGT